MKYLFSLSLILALSVSTVSAQGFLGKLKKAAESAVSSTANATISNVTTDFSDVIIPDIDAVAWNTLKPANSNLPAINTSNGNAFLKVDEALTYKFAQDGQFVYDGKVKSLDAVRAAGWKLFKNVKAISKTCFELAHAKQCWYLLSYEVTDEGDIVNRELHWVGWAIK